MTPSQKQILLMEPGPQGQAVIVADRKELEGLR